tara:strand:- start:51 stop:920 length:870 start_codon:yes stop_codon:yes gene_type:complete
MSDDNIKCKNGEINNENECECKPLGETPTIYYPLLGCMPKCEGDYTNEGVNCCDFGSSYKKNDDNAKNCMTQSQLVMKENTKEMGLQMEQVKLLQDPAVINFISEQVSAVQQSKCDYSGIQDDYNDKLNIYKEATSTDDYAETQNNIINMESLIKTYENLYKKQFNRIKELSDTRKSENKSLKNKLDNNKKVINTNKRKVVYETRELEWIQTYKYILLVVFYGLLVLYLIFGNFFSSNLYKNRPILITLILLSSIPILNIYIIRLIYFIVENIQYFMSNKAPKNVYTNL